MKRTGIFLIAILGLTAILTGQSHWESIILSGDQWRYLPATSAPPAGWYQTTFVDTTWSIGQGGFGYGDDDDNTVTSPVNSVYLRIAFQMEDKSVVEQLLLDIDYDDAFIAYLNNHEVARSSNVTDDLPLFNSSVSIDHEALMYSGGQPERYEISVEELIDGENILAVQILNISTSSSDMTGLVFLNAQINSPDILFNSPPDWFREPLTFDESNLPLIIINTLDQWIPDEPKIEVHMGIINNPGGVNKKTDPFNEYDGKIAIEIRGSSSQMFEKKNYTLETRTATGENNNVPLLGMPAENDWVLHGPYSDKSLMRNALTFQLGNEMGRWAPRTRFCELYINDDYRGVYLLMEKIKRDSCRLDISKLNPDEISGTDLTGGYILSIDRQGDYWVSPYPGMYGGQIIINYIYPEYADMPYQQTQYIKNYVTSFENALVGANYRDPEKGYRAYADVYSFIDYFLINELNRNVDAYRLSAFFYKNKNDKLMMGPLWDHNLSFGNADYYQGFNTQGWVMDGVDPGDWFQIPFWWERLRQDDFFNLEMKKRWQYLRQGPFNIEHINGIIDSLAIVLDAAKDRNFDRFPVLGQYIWPNYFIGLTYEAEINFLKDWISQRINWMDAQIELIQPVGNNEIANAYETYAFPNPFNSQVTIRTMLYDSALLTITIYNVVGQLVYKSENFCIPGLTDFIIPGVFFSDQTGIFIYEIRTNGERLTTGKIVRQ
jgi:hypothetical protein